MTDEEKQRKEAEELLREHNRMTATEKKSPYQAAVEQPGAGNATAQEARDRAAHTQPLHERGREDEQKRDLQEISDTKENARMDVWAKSVPPGPPPSHPEAREEYGRQHNRWQEQEGKSERGGHKETMTPEQQGKVDKTMADTNLAKDTIGKSSEASKATPNDPTPIEKSRDIGQDLNRNGVTMDKG